MLRPVALAAALLLTWLPGAASAQQMNERDEVIRLLVPDGTATSR